MIDRFTYKTIWEHIHLQTPQNRAIGVTATKFGSLNANTNKKIIVSVKISLAR